MLLAASRRAVDLTKRAVASQSTIGAPVLDQITTSHGTTLQSKPHGTEGRLRRLPVAVPKTKKLQGPRAYAPRLGRPGS